MKKNYSLNQRLIAYVLLSGLFSQSCGGLHNQVILQEKEKPNIKLNLSDNPLINTDKKIVTSGGYLAYFYQENGELKADLKADAKQPKPNYKALPVLMEKNINISDLTKLDPTTQQNRIQLNGKNGKINQVLIFNGGVAGGMKKGKEKYKKIEPEKESFEDLLQHSHYGYTLNLSNKNIDDIKAEEIATRLHLSETELHMLDLSNNKIGDKGAKAIAKALPLYGEGLYMLNLSNNKIGDEGAVAIAKNLVALKMFDLSNNKIGNKGAVAIAENLAQLKMFDLSNNKIDDEGAVAIANTLLLLDKDKKVHKLNLSNNKIGDKGAKAISESLSNLQVIDLSNANIGDEGAEAIARGLHKNNLQELDLSNNNISDKGAKAIADSLSKLDIFNLQELNLSNNNIGDEGAEAIARGLQEKGGRRCTLNLNLSNNKIGDKGAKVLTESLSNLYMVALNNNKLSAETTSLLKEKYPNIMLVQGMNIAQEVEETEKTIDVKALHKAVEEGNLKAVNLSLAHAQEADIMAKYNDGNTLLHIAAQQGSVDIVSLLVDKLAGPAPDKKNRSERKKWRRHKNKYLNLKNGQGSTMLHIASYKGNLALVKYLIGKGANINDKDKDGYTPFYYAQEKIVHLLENKGTTKTQIKQFEKIVGLLEKKGATRNQAIKQVIKENDTNGIQEHNKTKNSLEINYQPKCDHSKNCSHEQQAECPWCNVAYRHLYKLSNGKIILRCEDCNCLWVNPMKIELANAIGEKKLKEELGVDGSKDLFDEELSHWATKEEAQESEWKQVIQKNDLFIIPVP